MEPTVLIAMIVAVSAIIQVLVADRGAKKRQKADWDREDKIAKKADEVARALLQFQKEGIRRTDEVARVVAIATDETHSQLRQIHALVNSDMTKVLQADLDQTRITLALLRQLGDPDIDLVNSTEARVGELERVIAARVKASEA